jgi:hypothetical protein
VGNAAVTKDAFELTVQVQSGCVDTGIVKAAPAASTSRVRSALAIEYVHGAAVVAGVVC